jgi:hypothetical protein
MYSEIYRSNKDVDGGVLGFEAICKTTEWRSPKTMIEILTPLPLNLLDSCLYKLHINYYIYCV